MRQILIISLLVFSLNGRSEAIPNLTAEALRDSIVSFAAQYVGTPYVYAGVTEKGFDCTGFVYFVFKHFGITTSRSSSGYEDAGECVENDCSQPGDIILFTGTNSEIRKVGHAGIIYRNDNGTIDFIHSSSSKNHFGVTITRFNDSAGYQKRFLRIITILS
jgi:cell wall-associated NlpC family hydrolase